MSNGTDVAEATPGIVIIGAGPAGLTAAVELARRGHTIRIVDKGAGPSDESRALGVNARTLEILEPSGVTPRMLEAGIRFRRVNFIDPPRRLFTIDISKLDHRYNFMLSLPQADTERLLMSALEETGPRVDWRTELVGLEQGTDSARCTFATPFGSSSAEYGTVIGADGAHSFVRKAAGIGFDGDAYPNEWSLADVRLAHTSPGDEANVFQCDGAIVAMFPLRNGRFRFVGTLPDVLSRLPEPFEVAEIIWQSRFRIAHRQVETYQKGPVFLCGDAAHIHSPVGGRGMNLGIEDAATLAYMIDQGTTGGYTNARHPVGCHVLETTDRQTRFMTSQKLVPRLLRRYVFPLIAGMPAAQARALPEMAGLGAPRPEWLERHPA